MQVYAIVYCPETNEVLVFRKKKKGCFFKKTPPKNFRGYYLSDAPSLNGGGKYCFPGGRKDNGESFRVGAVREFLEETGVNLDSFTKKERFLTKKGQYECVVFLLKAADFFTIQRTVFIELETKEQEVQNIENQCQCKGIVSYIFSQLQASKFNPQDAITNDDVVKKWYSFLDKSPIEDDELESVERKNVQKCMHDGTFIQNDNATGWFYEMCEKLMAGNHGGRKRRYSFPL